jgi:hypothetical protein
VKNIIRTSEHQYINSTTKQSHQLQTKTTINIINHIYQPTTTITNIKMSSTTADMHRNSTSSTKPSAVKSALKAASRRLQEHHQAVNAAYGAYYGGGYTPTASTSASRRASAESAASVETAERRPSNGEKLWAKVKQHNRDVNTAYQHFYGIK